MTWLSTRLSGFQPRIVVPSAARSRRLTASSAYPTPHTGRAGSSRSNASRQTETTLSWTTSAKLLIRASRSGSGGPVSSPPQKPPDHGEVRVVPVEQDPGRLGAGRVGDAVEEPRDLRLADPDDVDAAEDDADTVPLERDRGRLEPEAAVPGRVVGLPDEADERQAERRLEREPRRAREEVSHRRCELGSRRSVGRRRDGCSSGVGSSSPARLPRRPALPPRPRLRLGEEALREPHPGLDEIRSTLGSNRDGRPTLL